MKFRDYVSAWSMDDVQQGRDEQRFEEERKKPGEGSHDGETEDWHNHGVQHRKITSRPQLRPMQPSMLKLFYEIKLEVRGLEN